MAHYAALVSLMNDLELIQNHPTHSFSFHNQQITSIWKNALFLVEFLDRFDSYEYTRESAKDLERRITYVVQGVHRLVEAQIVEQIEAGSTLGRKGIVSSYMQAIKKKAMQFLPRSSASFRHLLEAIGKMDSIQREAARLIEGSGMRMEQPAYSAPSSTSTQPRIMAEREMKAKQPAYSAPSTSSEPLVSKKNVMVGSDAVIVRLLDMLTGEPSDERLVVQIVGMGGIGKTTLVKHVYEHSSVKHHFDVCLWTTISQRYSTQTKTILAQLLLSDGEVSELGDKLHQRLFDRRYLVVLDDLWNVKDWDEVYRFLPDNGNGSRVVVTTRLSNLGIYLSSSSLFKMKFLDEESSWKLFCGKAFGENSCPVGLEGIAKKIVKRCRGLPLSIVVTGSHLRRSDTTIEYWEKVANYMNPILTLGDDDQCLNILNMSYHHLPPCLKPCFLYMRFFNEDEQIKASKLLRMWVAEGFLRANTGQTLEKVAEDYLNDLIERNLVLVGERRWNGKVESCVIHDVLRELCLKIAREEGFLADGKRRIVFSQGSFDPHVLSHLNSSLLRSPNLLRVSANVCNMLLKEDGICLPAAHSRQLNLRYLAFSSKKLSPKALFKERPQLPSSISLFWNLQTLAIDNFDVQISAPYEIWEMSQLRHLHFRGFYLPDPDPLPGDRSDQQRQECIVLENLQTLVGVEDLRLTEEVCKRMPNIKELSVFYDRFLMIVKQARTTALTILIVLVNWNL